MSKNAQKNKENSALHLFRDALLTKIEEEPTAYNIYSQLTKNANEANDQFSSFIQSVAENPNQYDEIMAHYYDATDTHREVFTELGIRAAVSFIKEAEIK